jgi:hypothetical protein
VRDPDPPGPDGEGGATRHRLAEGPVAAQSLGWARSPEQLVALNEPSTPSLDFPAAVTAELTPTFGFGGATVDGVELPVWPPLLTSPARYWAHATHVRPRRSGPHVGTVLLALRHTTLLATATPGRAT